MTHSSHHPETRVISTVENGAIEIGFWRVGSSFLKLGVKSGKVGSSFVRKGQGVAHTHAHHTDG